MKVFAAIALLSLPLAVAAAAQTSRDFDAEMHAKILDAKQQAGATHAALLVALCVESPSSSLNASDFPARYVADPSAAPPRNS